MVWRSIVSMASIRVNGPVRTVLVDNHISVPRSTDPNYHLTPDLADHAINWLKQAAEIDPDRPYFLYFAPAAMQAPHQSTPD